MSNPKTPPKTNKDLNLLAFKRHQIEHAIAKFMNDTNPDHSKECMKTIAFGLADSGWMDGYESRLEIVGFLFAVGELITALDQQR